MTLALPALHVPMQDFPISFHVVTAPIGAWEKYLSER